MNKDTIIKRIEKRKVLENRSDDELETILKRYDTYMETTRPVLDFYFKNPNFHEKFSDMFTLIRYTLSFRSGTKVSSLKPLNKYLSENNLSPTIIRTNRQVRKWLKELEKRV